MNTIKEFYICCEMNILRNYLDKHEIKWEDISYHPENMRWICRTRFIFNGIVYSVIHGYGTWGGVFGKKNTDYGLLEFYNFHSAPVGYLTADDIISRVFGKEINEE